jgi:hypothetical protein
VREESRLKRRNSGRLVSMLDDVFSNKINPSAGINNESDFLFLIIIAFILIYIFWFVFAIAISVTAILYIYRKTSNNFKVIILALFLLCFLL